MDNKEPINFFKQFLDDEFMQLLVTRTNLYAQQCTQGAHFKNNSRLAKWKLVDLHEMKIFLSLVICMGIVEKKGACLILVHRFCFWHTILGLNLGLIPSTNYDHLWLNWMNLMEFITQRGILVMMMLLVAGKVSVYNPAKPTCFGMKLYQVCEMSSG